MCHKISPSKQSSQKNIKRKVFPKTPRPFPVGIQTYGFLKRHYVSSFLYFYIKLETSETFNRIIMLLFTEQQLLHTSKINNRSFTQTLLVSLLTPQLAEVKKKSSLMFPLSNHKALFKMCDNNINGWNTCRKCYFLNLFINLFINGYLNISLQLFHSIRYGWSLYHINPLCLNDGALA